MNYDHDWKTQQSGCADNLWWRTYWWTHNAELTRFKLPEFSRNLQQWNFSGEALPSKIVSFNNFN